MAITDLGRAICVPKGAFNLLTSYKKLDIVTSGGSSYIAKLDTTGKHLTNTTYWMLLAQAGDFAGTATGVCGKNLLHNADWRNAVNQRDVSGAISATGYFYDRWKLNSGSIGITSGHVTLDNDTTVVEQRIEGNGLAGVEVIFSIIDNMPATYSATGTFPISTGTSVIPITGYGTLTLGYASGHMYVRFRPASIAVVKKMKLELGTVSTIDREPPSDYGEELIKCQRYFIRLHRMLSFYGYFHNSTTAYGLIPLPAEMRATPTLSHTDVFIRAAGTAGYAGDVTSVEKTGASLRLTITGTGYPNGEALVGRVGAASASVVYSLSSDL